MRPLIGIVARPEYPGDTDRLVVNDEYRRAVIESGGTPFLILPPQSIDYGATKISEIPELSKEEKDMLVKELSMCSGIVMPGGFKMINYDFFVLDYAIKNDIPILGICLGMQVMANYGRDVWNEKNDSEGVNHYVVSGELAHSVMVDKESKLYSILGKDSFEVNSFHNFHVLPSDIYNSVCYSEDGLIEGIEYSGNSFNIGVQWHPERMYDKDVLSRKLFSSFIDEAIKHSKDSNIYVHK